MFDCISFRFHLNWKCMSQFFCCHVYIIVLTFIKLHANIDPYDRIFMWLRPPGKQSKCLIFIRWLGIKGDFCWPPKNNRTHFVIDRKITISQQKYDRHMNTWTYRHAQIINHFRCSNTFRNKTFIHGSQVTYEKFYILITLLLGWCMNIKPQVDIMRHIFI